MISKNKSINKKQLEYMAFINRENEYRHHTYDEEMLQYEYLKEGKIKAIEESIKMFSSSTVGVLSDNPINNIKYLFVASITLATRFAIEGGMEPETAYNASDLFIQKIDKCKSTNEVKDIHTEMFTFFTKHMNELQKKNIYSKPIVLCMDYVYYHLNEVINVTKLAEYVDLNPSYLSTLFKKEVGITITNYIIKKRIEAAKNMLKFSNYSYSDISSYLSFSSQSYFIRVFKNETGLTPKEYRHKYYRISFD